MYGRTEYESDLAWLDSQRAEGSRLLIAGKINGFQLVELDKEIDNAERSCKNKLAGIRLAIGDREQMIRSGKLRYWKRSKGKLIMKAHGKESPWRITSEAELAALRASGYYLVELKGFSPQRDGGAIPADEADVAPPLLPSITKQGVMVLERAMEYLDEQYYAKTLAHDAWLASTGVMAEIVNSTRVY